MRQIFLFLSILAISSCSKKVDVNYTVFSGKIENHSGDFLTLKKGEFKKEIPISADGSFHDTLVIAEGYYTYKHNNETSTVYLKPGFNIQLSLDTKLFDESIKYAGLGADANNFIAQKYLTTEQTLPQEGELYTMEEDSFLIYITNLKNTLEEGLEASEIEDDFKDKEKQNLNYDYILSIQKYPSYHKHYASLDTFFALKKLMEPLSAINMDAADHFDFYPSYREIVINNFDEDIAESKDVASKFQILKWYKSQNIKNELLKQLVYEISATNESSQQLYEGIMSLSTDEKFKSELTNKYEKIKLLTKGSDSPKFTYNNIEGKAVSLDDLKGKLVYVDVWATWCGPCKREIPDLKALADSYKNKGIEFVSISIDKVEDHQKWLDMVAEKELKGIQLFADKDWESDFVKSYVIEGIPRFILIDQEGKIITSDAPRPSSGEVIKALIETHLKV